MSKKLEWVLTRIHELEESISRWRQRHSQSDPGAMMDLRDMRKELSTLTELRNALQSNQEPASGSKKNPEEPTVQPK